MIITAYQTLEDKDNIDEIETDGPFICTRADAWLGTGHYFWDTNLEWAISWGENSYKRNGKEYVIGRCQLDLSKSCFDLVGNVEHQMELQEVIDVLRSSGKLGATEDVLMPNLIQYLKLKGIFFYKAIRCNDNHDKVVQIYFKSKRKEYMVINQRVQVCVIDKKEVILRPFAVIYPEKYLES